jgi:hypothetical protein
VSVIAFDVLVLLISITSGLRAVPRNTIGSKYLYCHLGTPKVSTRFIKQTLTHSKYCCTRPTIKAFGMKPEQRSGCLKTPITLLDKYRSEEGFKKQG